MKRTQSKFFRFDLSSYPTEVNSNEVFEAEMRLYQMVNKNMNENQRIDVFQLTQLDQTNTDRKHIYSTIRSTKQEGWIKFDVTEAVRDWVTMPGMSGPLLYTHTDTMTP